MQLNASPALDPDASKAHDMTRQRTHRITSAPTGLYTHTSDIPLQYSHTLIQGGLRLEFFEAQVAIAGDQLADRVCAHIKDIRQGYRRFLGGDNKVGVHKNRQHLTVGSQYSPPTIQYNAPRALLGAWGPVLL